MTGTLTADLLHQALIDGGTDPTPHVDGAVRSALLHVVDALAWHYDTPDRALFIHDLVDLHPDADALGLLMVAAGWLEDAVAGAAA